MPRVLKRHDTADPITGTASDENGPVDLTVYESVTFQAAIDGSPAVIEGEVVVIEAETDDEADRGKWSYEQTDADVSVAGTYDVELECVLANGKKVHFPSAEADNPQLTIDTDLDNA